MDEKFHGKSHDIFLYEKKRALRRALSELAGDSHTYRHMKAVKNTASY
jgi:hypothetical protein